MKQTTIFLIKIWGFAFISSIVFKFFFEKDLNHLFKFAPVCFILLLPSLFAFIKFGNAILINSENDKSLNYQYELLRLAIFISTNIWFADFFLFTLLGNLMRNHFFTLPFFFTMTFGIYFFKVKEERNNYSEQILDDNLDFKK